jgi:hypothetical protein
LRHPLKVWRDPSDRISALAITSTTLSYSVRQRIFLYLGALIVLLAFGAPSGGLIDIPISFFLKNKLHLKAHEVAEFRLVAAIPPLPTSTLEIGA